MEIYKNWQIEKYDFGHYEAMNLSDCDADLLIGKSIEELKMEIDEISE